MHSQGESLWGTINTCIEIGLNIYYLVAEYGEGIVLPRKGAESILSEKALMAGREDDGYLYYEKGKSMDIPMKELQGFLIEEDFIGSSEETDRDQQADIDAELLMEAPELKWPESSGECDEWDDDYGEAIEDGFEP